MTQIPFEFAHAASHSAADFVVSESNVAAFAWVERWPDWPASGLCLYGPPGSGKSHLAALWRERSEALVVAAAAIADPAAALAMADRSPAFLLDDLDRPFDRGSERGLLHFYNAVAARGGHMLLIAQRPPAHWPITLADLGSRLAAIPAVPLRAPDDLLLKAVMAKLFADRQLAVAPEVLDYLAARIERSFAAVAHTVDTLDRDSLALGRGVTMHRARELLERSAAADGRIGR